MRNQCTRSTTRQSAQSPYSSTHGDNTSQIKKLSMVSLLHFLISFKYTYRHLQISTHKAACMTGALKDPQQLQKPSKSGARWQASTVPCHTVSMPTPPATCHLHMAQTDQIITSVHKDSSCFSYSSCWSMLHSKGLQTFRKTKIFLTSSQLQTPRSHF